MKWLSLVSLQTAFLAFESGAPTDVCCVMAILLGLGQLFFTHVELEGTVLRKIERRGGQALTGGPDGAFSFAND
jgi:hypothetical protein